jgi:hypothetical protein
MLPIGSRRGEAVFQGAEAGEAAANAAVAAREIRAA